MASPRLPGGNAEVSISYLPGHSPEHATAPEPDHQLLDIVRFLHERGNLASGSVTVHHARRIRRSRAATNNVRPTSEVMRVLQNLEDQGYIQISWWDAERPCPLIVWLKPKGYEVLNGHSCIAPLCHPPEESNLNSTPESVSLDDAERRLYFLAVLHEKRDNCLTRNEIRQALYYYVRIQHFTNTEFVAALEADGLISIQWKSRARRSVVTVRLLAQGLEQLHSRGHRCGANCSLLSGA